MTNALAEFDVFEIKLILNELSSTNDPVLCKFKCRVTFKEVEGVVPYPEFTYTSENWREVSKAISHPDLLLDNLLSKIKKFKKRIDFYNQNQVLIDNFINLKRNE